jgi:hypothetical protein
MLDFARVGQENNTDDLLGGKIKMGHKQLENNKITTFSYPLACVSLHKQISHKQVRLGTTFFRLLYGAIEGADVVRLVHINRKFRLLLWQKKKIEKN